MIKPITLKTTYRSKSHRCLKIGPEPAAVQFQLLYEVAKLFLSKSLKCLMNNGLTVKHKEMHCLQTYYPVLATPVLGFTVLLSPQKYLKGPSLENWSHMTQEMKKSLGGRK